MHINVDTLITISGYVFTLISALIGSGLVSTWKRKLPAKYQVYLDLVTVERVRLWIADANNLKNKTGQERKAWVINQVKGFVVDELDDYIPHSIADIIVEFVYDRVKDKLGV